ncbi:sulfotransferase [Gammaproteobacteria bacterium]|nr:sulfotransferase [Gammaproteobacteria bacterium]
MNERFGRAVGLFQAGKIAEAASILTKLTKKAPSQPVVWYNLGLCEQQLQKQDRAIRSYRKVLTLRGNFPDASLNLSTLLVQSADAEAAEHVLRNALGYAPADHRLLNLLGTVLAGASRLSEAETLFASAIEHNSGATKPRYNLAKLFLEQGRLAEAEVLIAALLANGNPDLDSLCLGVEIYLGLDQSERAATLDQLLCQRYPAQANSLRSSISIREHVKDHIGVVEKSDSLLRIVADDVGALVSKGRALYQLNAVRPAIELFEKARSLDDSHPLLPSMLGLAYSSLGDQDLAEAFYRQAIDQDRDRHTAYRYLSSMKKFKDVDDADIGQMKLLLDSATKSAASDQIIHLGFALGKVMDDLGQYDDAWRYYRQANDEKYAARRMKIPFAEHLAHFDRFRETLTNAPAMPSEHRYNGDVQPIFIVGMPRSGTTLTEQILARHSQVGAFGELPGVERAVSRLERRGDSPRVYPENLLNGIRPDEITAEADEYFAWIRRTHVIDTPYITDKMPFNFVHLWLIAAMFPDASIIHCQRHPLDVIVSNYFQFFGSEADFIYDLDALTAYYIKYHQLMQHWRAVLGERVKDCVYEELVSDPELATRSLISNAGLSWEDACLEQQQTSDAVRTASIWQVRQGIYQSSKQRWRRYAKHLDRVIDQLVAHQIISYPEDPDPM